MRKKGHYAEEYERNRRKELKKKENNCEEKEILRETQNYSELLLQPKVRQLRRKESEL